MYPNQGPYYQAPKPGTSPLVIVLIVIIVMLVLGGGGCLLCVGVAAISAANDPDEGGAVASAVEHDLQDKLRLQGIIADQVHCPAKRAPAFNCDLTVGSDTATMSVRESGNGLTFEVPGTAFLDGVKLTTIFQSTIAAKNGAGLRVPCFAGTLMKHVGADFPCDVFLGTSKAGVVVTTVDTQHGDVHMAFTVTPAVPNGQTTPPPRHDPRVVDFVCPAGQKPGGAVRAGCLCGNAILGTACGRAGSFTAVTETPKGCRFTCAD